MMTTPETQIEQKTVEQRLVTIELQQREILKATMGFKMAFEGFSKMFGMLATNFAPLLELDPKKQFEDSEETNKLVKETHAYLRKMYTDAYKPKPELKVEKITDA